MLFRVPLNAGLGLTQDSGVINVRLQNTILKALPPLYDKPHPQDTPENIELETPSIPLSESFIFLHCTSIIL